MTSEAFVWVWLPDATDPVVCARLWQASGVLRFVYGRSYRDRPDAIALDPHLLPLDAAAHVARLPERLPGPIADAAPDAWGRRVLEYRTNRARLSEIDYLLAGGGERIGALHFQASPTHYEPPLLQPASLTQLVQAAEHVEQQTPLPEDLRMALAHGTSIGGARPKATIQDDSGYWIAKFGASTDRYAVVETECATLSLAERCGITVPTHQTVEAAGRSVLLVRRFDRELRGGAVTRRLLLTALTLLQLDETEARLASYPALAEVLRRSSSQPLIDTAELFRRMVFNLLVGNTDDHAKNHACVWDGRWLTLTPAYDLVPLPRVGQEARQAMLVGVSGPEATLSNAYSQAGRFGLSAAEAGAIIDEVRHGLEDWMGLFADHGVPEAEIERLNGTTVLSPAVLR